MTDKDLKALTMAVECKGKKLTATSTKHHVTGDVAAKVARTAPDRRSERHALNINRTARAVGEGVSASLWLFKVMGQSFQRRGVAAEHGLPALDRMLSVALELTDDLEFEAHVAMSYTPEPAKKPSRRSPR